MVAIQKEIWKKKQIEREEEKKNLEDKIRSLEDENNKIKKTMIDISNNKDLIFELGNNHKQNTNAIKQIKNNLNGFNISNEKFVELLNIIHEIHRNPLELRKA